MGYTPLDDGLPTSTVSVCGGPIVLALWSVFMAWKDQDGLVKLTPRAVEALWSKSLMPLPLEVIQQAWDYLASPDPQSANPMCAGRRIVPTDDGRWRVVSHDKYRDRHSGAVLRSQAAERQQRRRDRLKQAKSLALTPGAAFEVEHPEQTDERIEASLVGSEGAPAPSSEQAVWKNREAVDAAPGAPSLPAPDTKAAYHQAIEERALEIVGRVQLTHVEALQIGLWFDAGVPLRAVLAALDGAERPKPGVVRGDIRTLLYFEGAVQDEARRLQLAGTL